MRAVRGVRALLRDSSRAPGHALAATLWCWQSKAFPRSLCSRPKPLVKTSPEVVALAEQLASLPIDDATFWLASAYAHWVGDERRTQAAMYFTPPTLAHRLIDDLVGGGASLTTHRWCDPACGGAAFLAPVARRMADVLRAQGLRSREILQHIEAHVYGNDIDPELAALSKQFLRMALYKEIVESGYEPTWRVTVGDALAASGYPTAADVVICNPPYRKMPASEVAQYRADFADILQGQPNLYALFFKRCLGLLPENGLAGFVTPTSFVSGQSFERLRTYLLGNAVTQRLSFVTEREGVFVGVEQEVAITVLRRTKRDPSAGETSVRVYTADSGFQELGTCRLPNSGAAWPLPRDASDAAVIRRVSTSPFRLSDFGYRPRIGWFVDYRDSEAYPPRTKVCANRSKKYLPLVWSSDIGADGRLQLNRLSHVRHKGYIELPKWHQTGIHRCPGVVLQRVTSPDQPKRLVGAPVSKGLAETGFVAENHVLVLEQLRENAAVSPVELVELLKSNAVDRYFRCISGAINVSVFELAQLPLPDPARLREALDQGKSMEEAVNDAFEGLAG